MGGEGGCGRVGVGWGGGRDIALQAGGAIFDFIFNWFLFDRRFPFPYVFYPVRKMFFFAKRCVVFFMDLSLIGDVSK